MQAETGDEGCKLGLFVGRGVGLGVDPLKQLDGGLFDKEHT